MPKTKQPGFAREQQTTRRVKKDVQDIADKYFVSNMDPKQRSMSPEEASGKIAARRRVGYGGSTTPASKDEVTVTASRLPKKG